MALNPASRHPKLALADFRRAIVVVTPAGEIVYADPAARYWLQKFMGQSLAARRLPQKVLRWLQVKRQGRRTRWLEIAGGDDRLFVRRALVHSERSLVLQLEVHPERHRPPARKHGQLTRREAEVHQWIAAGKSNDQIAQILGMCVSTVGKHAHRLYAKLGVDHRAAAAIVYHAAGRD